MSFDYGSIQALGTELLTEYGSSVTHHSNTPGAYDVTTGASPVTVVNKAMQGVLFDFGAGQTSVGGTLVQAGDKRLLVDSSATVFVSDEFTVNSIRYRVIGRGEINPAGTVILYDLHLRVGS